MMMTMTTYKLEFVYVLQERETCEDEDVWRKSAKPRWWRWGRV